ncbi:MAG: hypothetical protein HY791_09855 [Deltaproteobacteria bacterium]|nr:hypothetical protein [Deltaproteobacteria bacterium]
MTLVPKPPRQRLERATIERDAALDQLTRDLGPAFERAKARWSSFLLIEAPVSDPALPLAAIDLSTRKIRVNLPEIATKGIDSTIEAILAHELGHHVRWPGTLAVQARMHVIERQLIPFEDYSLVNLFTDLMINEEIGRELSEELTRIYRAYWTPDDSAWKSDPAFCLYLTVYEELWRLPRGAIVGHAALELEQLCPGARADAQILATDLFNLGPNPYTQFLFFVSIVTRYVKGLGRERPKPFRPCDCGPGEPSSDDWAEAMRPDAKEAEAIARALSERWFPDSQAERLRDEGSLLRRQGPLSANPARLERIPEIMASYYRRQAERFLFRPPKQKTLGEVIVPTTLGRWEAGDPVREIDWLATLNARGPTLGPALPERREKVAEWEGADESLWRPRIEIYLDVSGSMPDPKHTENAMTLAGQILALAAIRAGGSARAILYSHEPVIYQGWCRSELELSRFLMHHIGGGTEFPFAELIRSMATCGRDQPIRAVITDPDFDSNVRAYNGANDLLRTAATKSARFVLLQHRAFETRIKDYQALGLAVISVPSMTDFPRTAARLARVLFPDAGFES